MIKLKSLITEQAVVDQTKPFSLSNRDPYEYKLKNNVWYTKRKDAAEWLDMKAKISPANYTTAVDRLNAFSINGLVDTNKPVVDKKPADATNKPNVDIIPKVGGIPSLDFIPGLNQIKPKATKKPADDTKKPVKQDLGITRNKLGYITSNKSAVHDKKFTVRTNMAEPSVVVLKQLDIDKINRATGKINHSFMDFVVTLWVESAGSVRTNSVESAKNYIIGDIKTIVMPDVRGTSGKEDKNNGREFTYLYIVGPAGYKGWIPSNTVNIIS